MSCFAKNAKYYNGIWSAIDFRALSTFQTIALLFNTYLICFFYLKTSYLINIIDSTIEMLTKCYKKKLSLPITPTSKFLCVAHRTQYLLHKSDRNRGKRLFLYIFLILLYLFYLNFYFVPYLHHFSWINHRAGSKRKYDRTCSIIDIIYMRIFNYGFSFRSLKCRPQYAYKRSENDIREK